ncbi:MAG: oligosaccharide flippase family protein [Methanomethylovorans sp.]|uniref:oligosaccharide flippase family protein n=1 Tax=Methanomethylovorans sp. TaxID=2758717 RepID=UPI003530C2D5
MSTFSNNVLKLVSGSLIAQLLGICLIPVITRLYSPEDFGILQLFTSISGIAAIIACFSYQLSIMLPKNDEESVNIFGLCIILLVITSTIIGIIFLVFANQISEILNSPQLSAYLFLIPIAVFLNGLLLIMNYWLSRRIRFGVIAAASVSNTIFNKLVQIVATTGSISPFGLILGSILGNAAANIIMLSEIKKELYLFKHISIKKIKELAIRYKKFPIYTSWSTFANEISRQVPSFMLAFFYSTNVVGYYSLAYLAVNLPMSMIGSAVSQVFFQKASEEKNRTGYVKQTVSEVHKRLMSLIIGPMILILIIGDNIFSFTFGPEWTIAGVYAKILIPWIFLMFLSSPLTTLFSILEIQEVGLIFDLGLLFLRLIVLYIGGIYGNPYFTLLLYSLTGAIFCGIMNYIILKKSHVSCKDELFVAAKLLCISGLIFIPVCITKYITQMTYIILFVASIALLIYYIVIIFEDSTLKEFFTNTRFLKKYNR